MSNYQCAESTWMIDLLQFAIENAVNGEQAFRGDRARRKLERTEGRLQAAG
jgi:hypothetical protein